MNSNLDLNPQIVEAAPSLAYLTTVVFAESYILFNKFQSLHWNYTGPDFYHKHLLFERIYGNIYGTLDSIAEAIRSMDSVVHTSFDAISSLSKISCCDSEDTSLKYKSLETLIEDIDIIRASIRAMAAQANVERNQAVLNMAGDLDQNIYANAYYLISSHLK